MVDFKKESDAGLSHRLEVSQRYRRIVSEDDRIVAGCGHLFGEEKIFDNVFLVPPRVLFLHHLVPAALD